MPITLAEFKRFFAIGDGSTALLPGQFFIYHVPKNKKVVITDVYLQNTGVGDVSFLFLEQTGTNTYRVRYRFFVKADQTLSVNLSTGLRFGHEGPLFDEIRLQNDDIGTGGQIVPIVCGRLVG
jgi:hypothetical protein